MTLLTLQTLLYADGMSLPRVRIEIRNIHMQWLQFGPYVQISTRPATQHEVPGDGDAAVGTATDMAAALPRAVRASSVTGAGLLPLKVLSCQASQLLELSCIRLQGNL